MTFRSVAGALSYRVTLLDITIVKETHKIILNYIHFFYFIEIPMPSFKAKLAMGWISSLDFMHAKYRIKIIQGCCHYLDR